MKVKNEATVEYVASSNRKLLNDIRISKSKDASDIFLEILKGDSRSENQELFMVIALNNKHEVQKVETLFIGPVDGCMVSPSPIFKMLLITGACRFIVGHNHPSLDVLPSPDDIAVTKRLYAAGELLGIKLLDHLVVSVDGQYSSLNDLGLLE